MARFSGLGFCYWSMARATRLWLCVLGLAAGSSGTLLAAQNGATFTLHAYTDLIQIPVLVLSPARQPMAPIAASKFSVSLDGGPRFRSTHVRLEGDDPISLSILLDVSEPVEELLPKIDEAIAGLASFSLHSQDRVSVFALNCALIRSLNDAPAEQDRLKRAVDAALQSWTNRRQDKHQPKCQKSVQLWDALAYLTQALYRLPGRRVILAVTDGREGGTYQWKELRLLAEASGVTIFGLAYVPYNPWRIPSSYEDGFTSECELSGGMVFKTNRRDVEQDLERFARTLRGRYIVEFPRPLKSTAAPHDLSVRIEKSNAIILPSGIAVPIVAPSILADPTTVPSDPSRAPELGTRRILTAP